MQYLNKYNMLISWDNSLLVAYFYCCISVPRSRRKTPYALPIESLRRCTQEGHSDGLSQIQFNCQYLNMYWVSQSLIPVIDNVTWRYIIGAFYAHKMIGLLTMTINSYRSNIDESRSDVYL